MEDNWNYDINYKPNHEYKIHEENFMPYNELMVNLKVFLDPQHDGRLWTAGDIEREERILADDIIVKLSDKICNFVKKCKPYSIHGPV